MSEHAVHSRPGRSVWVIGGLALLWSPMGVATDLMTGTARPEAMQALPKAERVPYQGIPAWVTGRDAVAEFGGALASGLLLARKALALPLFWVSLLAVLAQMGHLFLMTPALEIRGPSAAVLPMAIIAVAAALLVYARSARRLRWLA